MAQIEFKKITKEYPDGTKALEDVDLVIEPGEFVFIVGPSGAGKTTLIKMLIREEQPTSGEALVDGVSVTHLKKKELPKLRRQIGVVFQEFKLLPTKTAAENVAVALEVANVPAKEIGEKVTEILRQVGLPGKENNFPRQLSGGEKQKLAIARALAHEPAILVADEPTGMIDPTATWEVMELLQRINKEGRTVIVCTHDTEIVDSLKKRVVALEHGRIARDQVKGKYHDEKSH
ncbi:MAG: cell division ATP-binding protein FtsE [bacterium]|nr:cell division ATP-binding protein FtsE [bacterium]